MERVVQQQLEEIGKQLESQVDDQLAKFESMKVDDLQSIRDEIQKKRKLRMELEKKWRDLGHGSYDELGDEKAFFDAGKKSDRFIVHFYREATERCKIVDVHLKTLAAQHLEARFCKIDAEKSPFLCSRLSIRMLPTILLLHKNIVVDRILGFTDLGNRDDFKTDMLEWRLALKDVIEYEGDKHNPPDHTGPKKKHQTNIIRKRNIRRGNEDSDDTDEGSD
ncbi:thioredoxin domain-containing protein 9 homolog [Folsomia candida]|uniref:Thioredoxin domain-containing protein 9 n=1 Tax=Folsomia candida TaxID=158441 RepID=A0A226EQV7_FOLCA|nr:thioredoxin domain-containing protein 9 homolog [Folsomia candida]OXA60015.1 Thioredoxin domain-containing protein 9 [Folsomia candida]